MQARLIDEAIAIRTAQYFHYVSRALHHLTDLPQYMRLPEDQQSNLALVCENLKMMTETKAMPVEKLLKLWDGF